MKPANFKLKVETGRLSEVRCRTSVCVQTNTPIKKVLDQMRDKKRGCAIVQKETKIVGIFTERDLLTRVLGNQVDLSTSIDQVMTPHPSFLTLESTISEAIQLMSQKGYRHIPLVNQQNEIQGFISVRDILDFLAEHFPYEVYSLPPDPHQINKTPEGA